MAFFMKRRSLSIKLLWLWATVCFLGGCDKLEDGNAISEALPGQWRFSYKTSEELDFTLSYEYVIFREDGSCAITYPGGQNEGSYRASDALIRIDTVLDDGREETFLWRVMEMSPYRIVTAYDYEVSDGHTLTLTVTLDRLN